MDQVLAYMYDRLRKEATVLEEDCITGKAADYAEYRHICGKHRGLLIAIDIVNEIDERMRQDDDTE